MPGNILFQFIKKQAIWIVPIIIFSFAWLVQSYFFINIDVSWLLEASKRMLSGGTYTKDLFENNPPWILYFNIPPVLIAKISSLSIIFIIKIYVFLLAAISLIISYYFFQRIFLQQDKFLAPLLISTLAILFVLLPLRDFGQREHLLFILTMPYFLLVTLRLQNQKINSYFAFTLGLLAGSVFLMKPYFLAPLVFIELYFLLIRKNIWAWLRPEILAMGILFLTYMALLILRHPDYIHLVMPFAVRWCYLGTKKPWPLVVFNHVTIFCFLSFMFCLATIEINRYKSLTMVLLLALAGFFVSYLVQQEDWPYHLLPLYFLSLFIFVLTFYLFIAAPNKKDYMNVLIWFLVFLLLLFLSPYCYFLDGHFTRYPHLFFCYMAFALSITQCLLSKNLFSRASLQTLFFSLLAGWAFYYADSRLILWNNYLMLETFLVMILVFCFFRPASSIQKKDYLLASLVVSLIFLLPSYEAFVVFNYSKRSKDNYQKLITYINQNARDQSVYFFTTDISHAFPTIIYADNTQSASRFSFFWALPGLLKRPHLPINPIQLEQLQNDKNFLIDMVSEDLNNKKPSLIFVDNLDKKNSLVFYGKSAGLENSKPHYFYFDYLPYFSENKKFVNAWKNYHYVTTLTVNYDQKIYPAEYQLILNYREKPSENNIKLSKIYLYLGDNNLNVALRNNYREVVWMTIPVDQDNFNAKQASAIKQTLSIPGAQLDNTSKNAILTWLSQQSLIYQFYKFNVYARSE